MDEIESRITEVLQRSREDLPSILANYTGDTAADYAVRLRQEAAELVPRAYKHTVDASFPLDAREAERRAERILVLAIRKGQADGTIETRFDARRRSVAVRETNAGRSIRNLNYDATKRPVSDFMTNGDSKGSSKTNGKSRLSIWLLAEISDELFERCVAQARKSRNLTREGLLRIVAGHLNGAPTTPQAMPRTSNRNLVANSIDRMTGIGDLLASVDVLTTDIDQPTAERLLLSLRGPLTHLNRIQRLLKNRAES